MKDVNVRTPAGTSRSTGTVMALTALSRILGFVRQATIGAVFGASGSADVINTVFQIPNNLRKLLAEGALSSAFIPVLSQVQARSPASRFDEPREIVRNLLAFQYLVLVPLLVLCVFFAGPITRVLLPFPNPDQLVLSARLFRWFVHYTLLISISAILVGTLNSCSRFTIPALTPTIFSVSVISSILLFHNTLGPHAMTVGVLVGGLGQVVFQIPQLRRLGYDLRPSFRLANPHFRQILKRWAPVVVASSIFALNQQIALMFASGLQNGSSSALTNAIVFWQLPQGVFGVSVMTVLFPRMSREAGEHDLAALRSTVGLGLRYDISLLIPASVILALLGPEIISVAFQRAKFLDWNTALAARVLWAYCIGMFSVVAFTFLQRFHYAWGDYRTPTYTAVVVVAVDVALSIVLKETALGVAGLALANSIAFSLGTLVLMIRARGLLHGIELARLGLTTVKTILAIIPAVAILVAVRLFWGTWWIEGSSMLNMARLCAVAIPVVAVTVAMYVLLRMEVVELIRRRRR